MTAPVPSVPPVLVGVDGSPGAGRAVQWAAPEAVSRGAPLHLVTATGGPGPSAERARRILDDTARTVAGVRGAAAPHTEAVEGDPATVLATASSSAAVVVVGHRDLTRIGSLWSGSVAVSLAGRTGCPLVIVPAPAPRAGTGPIVVGVDGTAAGEPAVRFAFAQAGLHRAPLVAVHTAPARTPRTIPLPDVLGTADMSRRLVAEGLDAWRRQYPGVAVHEVHTGSDPVAELLRRSSGAQLLVLGSRGLSALQGIVVGSVSHELLHRVGCPLAVVRAEGEPDMP